MGLFAILMTDRARRLDQAHLAGIVAAPDPRPSGWFSARVDASGAPAAPSDGPGAAAEDASRASTHYSLVWESAPAVVAGDRLEVQRRGLPGSLVYEVTNVPESHRGLPGGVLATTAEAVLLSDLYPEVATVEELGGAVVEADVPIGLWRSADGIAQPSGVQYDYDAVMPWTYAEAVDATAHPNRQVRVAGQAYRIVGSSPRERVPRVVLRLRRMGAGG